MKLPDPGHVRHIVYQIGWKEGEGDPTQIFPTDRRQTIRPGESPAPESSTSVPSAVAMVRPVP